MMSYFVLKCLAPCVILANTFRFLTPVLDFIKEDRMGAEKRYITTQKAIEILSENGVKLSKKKAEEVLDLMYFLARLIVNQNFKK